MTVVHHPRFRLSVELSDPDWALIRHEPRISDCFAIGDGGFPAAPAGWIDGFLRICQDGIRAREKRRREAEARKARTPKVAEGWRRYYAQQRKREDRTQWAARMPRYILPTMAELRDRAAELRRRRAAEALREYCLRTGEPVLPGAKEAGRGVRGGRMWISKSSVYTIGAGSAQYPGGTIHAHLRHGHYGLWIEDYDANIIPLASGDHAFSGAAAHALSLAWARCAIPEINQSDLRREWLRA